jgi:hypothetical protein
MASKNLRQHRNLNEKGESTTLLHVLNYYVLLTGADSEQTAPHLEIAP